MGFAIEIVHQARLSIYVGKPSCEFLWYEPPYAPQYAASHLVCSMHFIGDSKAFAAAIGMQHNVLGQQVDEAAHLAGPYRFKKPVEQILPASLRGRKPGPGANDSLLRSMQNLTTVRLGLV